MSSFMVFASQTMFLTLWFFCATNILSVLHFDFFSWHNNAPSQVSLNFCFVHQINLPKTNMEITVVSKFFCNLLKVLKELRVSILKVANDTSLFGLENKKKAELKFQNQIHLIAGPGWSLQVQIGYTWH